MNAENHNTSPTPKPLPQVQRARRDHDFFPSPEIAATIPMLRDDDTVDPILRAHYRAGAMQWWVAEYDPADGSAWCLFDSGNGVAEWGEFSLLHMEEALFPQDSGPAILAVPTLPFTPIASSVLLASLARAKDQPS